MQFLRTNPGFVGNVPGTFYRNTVKVAIFGYKPRSNCTVPVPYLCFSRTVPGRICTALPVAKVPRSIVSLLSKIRRMRCLREQWVNQPKIEWIMHERTDERVGEWTNGMKWTNPKWMKEGTDDWMSEMSGRGISEWRGERMNELPCFEHLALKMLNLVSVVYFFLMFVSLFIPVFRY